jgi:hypothetical protein
VDPFKKKTAILQIEDVVIGGEDRKGIGPTKKYWGISFQVRESLQTLIRFSLCYEISASYFIGS